MSDRTAIHHRRRRLGRRLPLVLSSARSGSTRRLRPCRTSMSTSAGGRSSSIPTIPPEGKDRKQYMLAKFGSEERLREIHARIEPLGEAEGIDFDFDAIKVSPNTLDAHRVHPLGGGRRRRRFRTGSSGGCSSSTSRKAGISATTPCWSRPRARPAWMRRWSRRCSPTDADRDAVAERGRRPPRAWASPACPASCSKANTR